MKLVKLLDKYTLLAYEGDGPPQNSNAFPPQGSVQYELLPYLP